MSEASATPTFQGYGTKAYRAYVLLVLVVIYTFNFIDRSVHLRSDNKVTPKSQ